MQKVTQKFIREMIADGMAHDVSDEYTGEPTKLHERYRSRSKVCYSAGIYGINGAVWKLDSGELIAVPSRNTALFVLS